MTPSQKERKEECEKIRKEMQKNKGNEKDNIPPMKHCETTEFYCEMSVVSLSSPRFHNLKNARKHIYFC